MDSHKLSKCMSSNALLQRMHRGGCAKIALSQHGQELAIEGRISAAGAAEFDRD